MAKYNMQPILRLDVFPVTQEISGIFCETILFSCNFDLILPGIQVQMTNDNISMGN